MSTESVTCHIPRYVLLADTRPTGPSVVSDSATAGCVAVYGFSDKRAYDIFITNSGKDLRPYPLMNGYLKNQIAEGHGTTHLVIVDAVSTADECLTAVTMQNALAAQSRGDARINDAFSIMRCRESNDYKWDGVPN